MSTAFHIRHSEINRVCKNQDVIYEGVYAFTNHRGMRKTALIRPPAQPACWVSVYGSLTLSQVGKDQPNGGMNEAGLVVEQTTLWQTEYPPADERPALGELAWMQYLLDTCGTVEEALEAAAAIRIDQSTSKLHYLVADRSGDLAIVEFLQGDMIVHREPASLPVMANTAYADAVRKRQKESREWQDDGEYERNSMERFRTVADALQVPGEEVRSVESAFAVLAAARREDTVYSLVYDLERMELHAKLASHLRPVTIAMADFDFAKETPAQAANLQTMQADRTTVPFEPYSVDFNRDAIRSFFRDPHLTSVFKWEIPEEMIECLARYPDSFEQV
ncbi:carcinine hydrolase/isopenicillin-N N-acyltransferase family protein [Paenibacillus puerhi]|uniref:carcinine hydrolase/isopenicillin-N N-acyltransferase family protein n=1 Tax=Paenibacillus puerhi TaxID=2692622 RepID=UPI001357AC7C|nr:carcinine hydrolase/isopenicillin-N N-acyltransferase family protein [Paenibacillus puerhi]